MVQAQIWDVHKEWNECKLSVPVVVGGGHMLCYGEDMQVVQEVMEGLLISRLEAALLLRVC